MASTPVISEAGLKAKLEEALKPEHIQIVDTSGGCGSSFAALIVSSAFQGKTLLARHRIVNAALKDEIAEIHAWTPKCLTPEQWAAEGRK